MKRFVLVLVMILGCAHLVQADNVPIYTPEYTLSHTMVIGDFDTTGTVPNRHLDTCILGPFFLDPRFNSWRRSLFLDLDSIFQGDTLQIIGQTCVQRNLTARVVGTSRALGWTLVDSTQLIPAADTNLMLSPRFQMDSLGTVGWTQAVFYRVIIRNLKRWGYTGSGEGTPNIPAAVDSAIVGNTYRWRFQYYLLPTSGGSKDTY